MYAFYLSVTAALVLALSPAVATAARDDASKGNGSKASSLVLDGLRGRSLATEVAPGLALGLRYQRPLTNNGNGPLSSNGNAPPSSNGNVNVGSNGNNDGNNGNAGVAIGSSTGNTGSSGGSNVGAIGAGANDVSPVPEPSSMIVFAAGLLIARGAGRLARRAS